MPSSPSSSPASLDTLRISAHQIPAHEYLPNTALQHRPLLIYHGAFRKDVSAAAVEGHLKRVGVVVPQWRYTMYSRTHFHSTTHEVLVIVRGAARLCFGGEANPGRIETSVQAGDVLVVPAGVAHRLLHEEGEAGGFEMVGSYPAGFQWDMCYGREDERAKVNHISTLAWFERDPIFGDEGPVLKEGAQKQK